ncbi:MAG: hypothetical protein JO345_16125 [Streptosporangiaceae bacterium]|nr:hypothetical protein [Streptosporangiaceae bacterium]
MHLAVALDDTGWHPAGSHIEFSSFAHMAQTAERAKFDFLFLAEGLRLREQNGKIYDLDVMGRPDTFTVLAARYDRARTFLATAFELFDSWHGDEIVADKASGVFLADASAGRSFHKDLFFDINGRFNVAAQWRALAAERRLSIRELIIEVTGRQTFVGSPATVAAAINDLVQADASDGFILVPHITPGGLDEFAGSTLREHLGLAPL